MNFFKKIDLKLAAFINIAVIFLAIIGHFYDYVFAISNRKKIN